MDYSWELVLIKPESPPNRVMAYRNGWRNDEYISGNSWWPSHLHPQSNAFGKEEEEAELWRMFLSLSLSFLSFRVCVYQYRNHDSPRPFTENNGQWNEAAPSWKQASTRSWHVVTLTGPCMEEAKVLRQQELVSNLGSRTST